MDQPLEALLAAREEPAPEALRAALGRRRRRESRWREAWHAYRFEIVLAGMIALGMGLLLTDPGKVRTAAGRWLMAWASAIRPVAEGVGQAVWQLVDGLHPDDLVGIALVLSAICALLLHTRSKLMHDLALTAIACPRCRGTLHRVHRHALERVASWYVPLHRYSCTNRACRWKGLRVVAADSRGRRR